MKMNLMTWQLALLILSSCGAVRADDDTILCEELESLCTTDGLEYVTNLEEYCGDKAAYANVEVCNCGAVCLTKLEEGDDCKTSFTLDVSDSICGFGLDCMRENETDYESDKICQRNTDKECVAEYLDYEWDQAAGVVGPGRPKPNCNEFGQYASKQCTPEQTCYCADESGTRLFGEELQSESVNMTCDCAVYWQTADFLGLSSGPRCLPDGGFDPLQCYGNVCFCYDATTNEVSIGPLPFSIITEIDCYDPTIHRVNYTNPCEEEREKHSSLFEDTYAVVVGDSLLPNCTHDGYYAPVQYSGSTAYCVDYLGEQIEDFKIDKYLAGDMNCYCARRRAIMQGAGVTSFLPVCCPNGNFRPIQIRGLYSFCVDVNGNQVGSAVTLQNEASLSCDLQQCIGKK